MGAGKDYFDTLTLNYSVEVPSSASEVENQK